MAASALLRPPGEKAAAAEGDDAPAPDGKPPAPEPPKELEEDAPACKKARSKEPVAFLVEDWGPWGPMARSRVLCAHSRARAHVGRRPRPCRPLRCALRRVVVQTRVIIATTRVAGGLRAGRRVWPRLATKFPVRGREVH